MKNIKVDYLIIGQGLAGTLLAWELLARKKTFLIIDNDHQSSSSTVAAGLVNPLAGKRFNLASETGQWLSTARNTYRSMEQHFGQRFWHELEMARLLKDDQQGIDLEKRQNNPDWRPYLGTSFTHQTVKQPIYAPRGGFIQKQTGYLDMKSLLSHCRDQWLRSCELQNTAIDHQQITVTMNGVKAPGIDAGRVIFCEGYKGQFNPWFDWLPFTPVKGEILTLQSDNPLPDKIINGAHWLLPTADQQFKFGSTYNHDNIDTLPSTAGRQQLLEGIKQLLPDWASIRVIEHQAGVRPATTDRHPFTGLHPETPRVGICNGFGSRGALLAPWYIQQFIEHLESGQKLPADGDIQRFA